MTEKGIFTGDVLGLASLCFRPRKPRHKRRPGHTGNGNIPIIALKHHSYYNR